MIFAAQKTPERLNYLQFTEPYLELRNMILVRKDRKGGANLKEMTGWSVAVSQGSAVQEYLQREFPALDLHPVPDELTGLRQVSLGEVDAMVVEISRASYYIQKAGILNLHVSGEAGLVYRLRFAVRSDWPELARILDHGLAAITPAERRAIYRRWILVGGPPVLADRRIWITLAAVTGGVALTVIAILVWNRALRRQVKARTLQLQHELAERRQTEEALRDAATWLNEAQHMAHIGCWELNLRTGKLSWSDEIYRLFEVDPAEFGASYQAFLAAIHPDDREAVNAAYTHSLETKTPYAIDHRLLMADGRIKHVHEQCETFYEQDTPYRSLGTVQDITERKQAEEALRATLAEVHDLYNQAPCGYHSLDREGKIIRINDTELRWLGFQREEVEGRLYFQELLTDRSRQLFQENFPRFRERGWVSDLEFELRRSDGSLLPVLLSATAVYADGAFLMSRAAVYDITERRKAAAQEHLLSTIVQSSDDAILAKDLQGTILSWNSGAERIYGYRAEEAVGQSVEILVPAEGRAELATILQQVKRGERIEHFITKRLRKDGELINVAMTISPIRETDGHVVGAATVARDVTKQMRAEQEIARLNVELEARVDERTLALQESQRALMNIVEDLNEKTAELEAANAKLRELDRLKSMFIASMSHELRTPLNSIIGFSSILHDAWLGPVNTEQKENLATILRCGKHLLTLINDVIDVSKIEAGKIESSPESFDLRELVNEAVDLVGPGLQERGLELHLEVPSVTMYTDRQRLLQCLLNLLSNAMKFTEQGGVTVAARVVAGEGAAGEGSMVEIAVTDTGIGIRPEDRPKLFQPFVRLDSPLKGAIPGTGLGLYLSRRLAGEILRGDILLTSEFGRGSCFTLRLPVRLP